MAALGTQGPFLSFSRMTFPVSAPRNLSLDARTHPPPPTPTPPTNPQALESQAWLAGWFWRSS